MGKLRDAFLRQIGQYMLVETPVARADVCLVFGCQAAARCEALAEHAAGLYEKGYFGLIVVSGGLSQGNDRTEAQRMREVLVARGVPDSAILVEDKANNTGENVRYMMDLLAREKGLENISSVLAIGQLHAARRFVMTLERHWPAVTKMFSAPNYYGVAKEDWYKDPVFREDVLREYRKIPDYKDKDFISEIDPAAMKQAIAVLPPPRGPLRKPPAGP